MLIVQLDCIKLDNRPLTLLTERLNSIAASAELVLRMRLICPTINASKDLQSTSHVTSQQYSAFVCGGVIEL